MTVYLDQPMTPWTAHRLRALCARKGLPVLVEQQGRVVTIAGDQRVSYDLLARLARGL